DRHHRVDGFVTGLHGLADRLTINHARRNAFDRRLPSAGDRAFAVDRLAERIDDAAEHCFSDRHFENAACGLDAVPFDDVLVLAQDDGADGILFQVQRKAEAAAGELEHFTVLRVREAVNAYDAVGYGNDGAYIALFGRR